MSNTCSFLIIANTRSLLQAIYNKSDKMKVAIIVFSPTGNTLKVAKMLEEHLLERKTSVQIIDITRVSKVFRDENITEYLNKKIKKHDVLCIGSPVYAHHFHYNVKNIIKSLPEPDNKWGELAVPFVTYGGISSGVALLESAKLLKKSGRIPALALKINSEHCMTKLKQINVKVNKGMPGKEAIPLIDALANKILQLENCDIKKKPDILSELKYLKFKERMKDRIIFNEKLWQNHLYPKLVINPDKCIKCGICSRVCPVQRIVMSENGPIIPKESPRCIHCVSCMYRCPTNAIESNADWSMYNKLLKKSIEGRGPIQSNEEPKSAIYG